MGLHTAPTRPPKCAIKFHDNFKPTRNLKKNMNITDAKMPALPHCSIFYFLSAPFKLRILPTGQHFASLFGLFVLNFVANIWTWHVLSRSTQIIWHHNYHNYSLRGNRRPPYGWDCTQYSLFLKWATKSLSLVPLVKKPKGFLASQKLLSFECLTHACRPNPFTPEAWNYLLMFAYCICLAFGNVESTKMFR